MTDEVTKLATEALGEVLSIIDEDEMWATLPEGPFRQSLIDEVTKAIRKGQALVQLPTVDTNAWRLMADILDRAGDEFNRHSANEQELDDTPENRALLVAMERWNDGQEHTEAEVMEEHLYTFMEDGKPVTKLVTMDWFLASYFSHLAAVFAGDENEPRKRWVVSEYVHGDFPWTISAQPSTFDQVAEMLRQVRDRDIVVTGGHHEAVLWLWKKLGLDQKYGNVYFEEK